jgi:hypothetical protein
MNSQSHDPERDPEELQDAAEETRGASLPAELSSETTELVEWDQPPDASGVAAPKATPEDESSAGEILVNEGLEEADRDQRIASADPDFQP